MKMYTLNCGRMRIKMKTNIRGDSGLSDSGLQRSHKFYLEKHKDTLDKIEKYGKIEIERRKSEAKTKKKNSLWQTIKGWFNVK